MFLSIRLLKLTGRPDSKDLMREGVEVSGVCGPSVEDPVPEVVKTLVDMSAKSYAINIKKYADVLDYVNRKIDIAMHEKDKNYATMKYKKYMKWIREVFV